MRYDRLRQSLVLLLILLVAGASSPVWAQPPGSITVAEYRAFLDELEERYDQRAARAVAVFYAEAALTQESLWSDCLRAQSVRELREWLHDAAPADLSLQQALRLNAKARGCEPRDQADVDAEFAIRSGWRYPNERR